VWKPPSRQFCSIFFILPYFIRLIQPDGRPVPAEGHEAQSDVAAGNGKVSANAGCRARDIDL